MPSTDPLPSALRWLPSAPYVRTEACPSAHGILSLIHIYGKDATLYWGEDQECAGETGPEAYIFQIDDDNGWLINFRSFKPVSYTHRDVYKRQAEQDVLLRKMEEYCQQQTGMSLHDYAQQFREEPEQRQGPVMKL